MTPSTPPLMFLGCVCRYVGESLSEDIAELSQPPGDGVTGVLVHDFSTIVQVMEGPARAITAMVSRLATDQRLSGFTILFGRQVQHRRCENWSMLAVDEGRGSLSGAPFRAGWLRLQEQDIDGFLEALSGLTPAMESASDSISPSERRPLRARPSGKRSAGSRAATS